MDPLVSTEWLARALGAPDLKLLDASWFLPEAGIDARAAFAAAHLPGARFFDIGEFSDPDTELPHMLPTPGRFARLIGTLGISHRHRVVVYDQHGIFSAPRAWWMLGVFGLDEVAVLDGGLPKWCREGRELAAGEPPPAMPVLFRPSFRAALVAGAGDVEPALAAGAVLLDARSAPRFAGTAPEPRSGVRSGHIPGARNCPYASLLAEDGTLLPQAALRARLAAVGVDGSRPVITSCGSGVTAAILTLALARIGLPMGALYDGSWAEWGEAEDWPLER